MDAPIPLRPDFNAPLLRKRARGSRNPDQIRRLLALSEIYDGSSRSDAARIGGVGLQIVRDWVLWSTPRVPDGLVTPPSQRPSAPGAAASRRGRPDASPPWRRALAAD